MNNEHTIRHLLQLKARGLQVSYYERNKSDKTALAALVAAIDCYLDIRKSLAPYVAPDGYMQELSGISHQLCSEIEQLDNPPAPAASENGHCFFSVSVRVDLMDSFGTASPICETYVLVSAAAAAEASKAAVAYFASCESQLEHIDDVDPIVQSRFEASDTAGDLVWLKERGIRYASTRVLLLGSEEADHFKTMTAGLMNVRCIIA